MNSGAAALDRRITAYHEAAHAVVAFRFGISIDEVALCRAGPLAGYVQITHVPLIANAIDGLIKASNLNWFLVARDTEHRAMVLLAGAIAESKLLAASLPTHGNESDFVRCLFLCQALYEYRRHLVATQAINVPEVEPVAMANRLKQRTRAILGHPPTWRAVIALAEDVEAWTVISGDEAADTVQWTRRIQSQLSLLLPMPRKVNLPEDNDVPRVSEPRLRSRRSLSNGTSGRMCHSFTALPASACGATS